TGFPGSSPGTASPRRQAHNRPPPAVTAELHVSVHPRSRRARRRSVPARPGRTGRWLTNDLWLDSVSQVRMDRWSNGRVMLVGDAVSFVPLFGDGTTLAIAGAAVAKTTTTSATPNGGPATSPACSRPQIHSATANPPAPATITKGGPGRSATGHPTTRSRVCVKHNAPLSSREAGARQAR